MSSKPHDRQHEGSIRACYRTWSTSYFRDYYASDEVYPPVHVKLIRDEIARAAPGTVLDAGCGPASVLRLLGDLDIERFGFDLTPEMVEEARRVLDEQGVPPDSVWEGSVLDPHAFRAGARTEYDAVLCVGVLPHIPADADSTAVANLVRAVRPGGLVVMEARNELFALFTLNRYSRDLFLDRLMDVASLRAQAGPERESLESALTELNARFRLDLPPTRRGSAGEPGYDEVLSRTHNPFELRQLAEASGLVDVRTLFYHYHAVPPMVTSAIPQLARSASLEMEDPTSWKGHFMASAFLVVGKRA